MKKALKIIGMIIGVLALIVLLIVGGFVGLFFQVKNQEEGQVAEVLNQKPLLREHLGEIKDVNIDLMDNTNDKRTNLSLMILDIEGTKTSGTLTYGGEKDGNGTTTIMELKLADGSVINLIGKMEILGWGAEHLENPESE